MTGKAIHFISGKIRSFGNFIFEINYVAPAASFNREEADQIIASFHKL